MPFEKDTHYNLRGGLHSAEIRMLQRALKMYMQEYNKLKRNVQFDHDYEKQQMQDAMDAAVRLSNRLRRELEPIVGGHK